jgi:hypothetical protein
MRTLIEMAHEVYGEHTFWTEAQLLRLKELERLVRADEREACAKVCEQTDEEFEGPDQWDWHSKDYASAIRARGETK